MKLHHVPFSAKVRRYKHLAKKVNRLLKGGAFQLLPGTERRNLLTKLRQRLRGIGHLLPQARLRESLAGIAILLGTAAADPLAAQTFAPTVTSPFGIISGMTYGYPGLGDVDGDADLDLVVFSYDQNTYEPGLYFYPNLGVPQVALFTADNLEVDPFGLQDGGSNAMPIFVDIDNDGDLDLFAGNLYTGGFTFQENTGMVTDPAYAVPVTNPFGLTATPPFNFATAADIDNDGDTDLLGGGYYGNLYYFENTGTTENPAFDLPVTNPFGIQTAALVAVPHLTDLDGDGDYDLLFMSYGYTTQVFYAENVGTPETPAFDTPVPDPFGISANGFDVVIPSSADMDSDGDVDVFIFEYYGNVTFYYENLTIDLPNAPFSSDNVVNVLEDELLDFDPSDFIFLDGDAGDDLQAVQITSLPAKGSLTLGVTPVTPNQIIQFLDIPSLQFEPDANENGMMYADFQFKVYDGGLWSADDYTMSINVQPVNDAPTTQDAAVTGIKNMDFIFAQTDFPFADIENDAFSSFKIITLPAKGTLKIGGTNAAAGQELASAQIGTLTFTPLPGEFGLPYTGFGFKVSDGQGYSPLATMTVNIQESSASHDERLDASLKLSPNPVAALLQLSVEATQPLQSPEVLVLDALGREIKRDVLAGSSQVFDYQLDVSGFAAGFYFIKIQSDGKTAMLKFVKA
ncbi:MAG: VCBS repeat-containing protein [Bacteroidetes bacterium]|nr:VCBS repeat-containing protein [Bacteroidota bacterium]